MLKLTLVCLALAAAVSSDSPDLKWPSKYAFEISKVLVKSGLVEDVKVWRTPKQSRVEYNKGAVMNFVVSRSGRRHSSIAEFEIHPVTTRNGSNKLECNYISSWHSSPADVLPEVDGFEEVGEEMMKDLKCTKFKNVEVSEYLEKEKFLWASYSEKLKAWIPTRFEQLDFNTWLGYNDKHEIWDFDNFQSEFDEKEIFNPDEYCNRHESGPIRHDKNDESVTKHLMFTDPENNRHVDHVFKAFKKNFNRNYAHEKEHALRRRIFKNSMRRIVATNRRNLGYKLAVNRFADRTPQEVRKHTGLLRRPKGEVATDPFPYTEKTLKSLSTTLPKEHDLRLLGIVPPIENQEQCGSCWTFGTTAAAEGALARYNGGKLLKLANQALIDCGWEFGSQGCDGGTDTGAYEWMMKYGLPTEAEYGTYADQDGYCLIKNMTKTYPIRGFVDVTPNSIGALKVALFNHGPLSVSVHVTDAFTMYSSGIFYDLSCDPTELNHEITLIGYGEYYGDTFWIVKNSWGPEWGIDGYMHILAKDNNCGIMTEPTYVLI